MAARPPLTRRLTARQWMAVDAAVAVAMLLALLAFAARGHPHHPHQAHRAWLYALAPAASLPLTVRRRWPVAVFVIVLTASTAYGVLGSDISTVTGASYALYTVAVQADRRWSRLALLAAEAGVGMSFALTRTSTRNPVNGAFTALIQLTIWIVGDSVRRHRGYTASLREQAVSQALGRQRLQIARELHDVIAHALSIIAVQAGVGGHLAATRPEQAASSLDAIAATAREALAETRYLLSALRDESQDPASLAPVPRISNLGALIDQLAETGLPVTLHVEGQPRMLSASVELSAYRIVQEALTNVVRHARQPTLAAVVIRYDAGGDVVVEVTDDGSGPGSGSPARVDPPESSSGYGLAGMRERIGLLGGELRAGPRAGGGYLVSARLPAQAGVS